MSRGFPDYVTFETETVIKDLDEISVDVSRTGFSRVDGGGRVVWFDDFSMGKSRVYAYGAPLGSVPSVVMEDRYTFGLSPSLKFDPIVDTGQSVIDGLVPVPKSGKMGLEFGYYLRPEHGSLQVSFAPFVSSGTHEGFILKLHQSTNAISLYVNGVYQAIFTPVSTSATEGRLFQVKMVCDPYTRKYERVFFGSERIETPYDGANNYLGGEGGGAFFSFIYQGQGANNKNPLYLGYILVTADEQ